jgi:predicted carbohydrate-binding protein with CBM5 and CBM33 domain
MKTLIASTFAVLVITALPAFAGGQQPDRAATSNPRMASQLTGTAATQVLRFADAGMGQNRQAERQTRRDARTAQRQHRKAAKQKMREDNKTMRQGFREQTGTRRQAFREVRQGTRIRPQAGSQAGL